MTEIRSGGLALALVLASTVAFADDAPAPRPATPIFQEEQATESGVNTVYDGDWEFMVGGGVSTFDCDDDGFPTCSTGRIGQVGLLSQ